MDISKSPLIFIIDDQLINLRLITILLEKEGFKIEIADNAEEGIRKIEEILPDLILLDIMMPNIDGFEACKRLKASKTTKNIPVIFMTGLQKTQHKVKGFELGAVDYITKPFEYPEVLSRINNQLQLSQLHKELKQHNDLLKEEIEKRKITENNLLQSKQRLKTIFNNDVNGIIVVDKEGTILFVNPSGEKIFGLQSKNMIGENLGIPFIHQDLTNIDIPHPSGKVVTAEMRVVNIFWENQEAYLISLINISDRQKLEEKLNILFKATEQSTASIVITNKEGNIEYINPKFEKISGYTEAELLGKNPRILKSGYTSDEEYEKMWKTLMNKQEWLGEFQNKKKNGELYWETAHISPIINSQGIITNFVAIKEDITEKKKQEEKLEYQACYDILTDIPNRAFGLEKLDFYVKQAEKKKENLGLMFVDLDKFKEVNDTLGHDFGDLLLKQTVARIKGSLRETDFLARLGGDEFLIIIPFQDNKKKLQKIANRIINCLQKPFYLDKNEVSISASIGITVYPEDAQNTEDLIRNADLAMLSVKRNGRNNYQMFTNLMKKRFNRNLQLQQHLNQALINKEFKLLYQPIIDFKSEKIVCVEALIHWENPQLGLISPKEFIPIAEETGLMINIGEWLFFTACQQAAIWQNHYNLPMAINLSYCQFTDNNLLKLMEKALIDYQLDPDFLELEIKEGLLLKESSFIEDILTDINRLNIGLSLDNFGTGYCSLIHLTKFPFQTIKIDPSLIAEIVNDEEIKTLVKTIIIMAKSLHIKVVAEGIENQSQFTFLKNLGCDYGQGNFFSEPLSNQDFFAYLSYKNRQNVHQLLVC